MDRIRVAVLLGGRSSEHAISCVSGGAIVAALDPARYDVRVVGIRRDGAWVQSESRGLDLLDMTGVLPEVGSCVGTVAWLDALDVDVVFPVLHGPWGEDGSVQGLLETAGIPFVGSGVLSSAVAMDKGFMKTLLCAAGLPVGDYVALSDRQWRTDPDACRDAISRLGLPVFVKPARAGSSLGISRVDDAADVETAIGLARSHDPRIIVEAAALGVREIECGVLADAHGVPQASRCSEIVVRADLAFYDFEAKYLDDSVELIVPADLPGDVEMRVRHMAVQAFEALACEGLARVDFFVHADGRILVNEVNTMPGFTSISMFPRMWEATGVSYPVLVDRLVQDALRKGTDLR